MTIITSKRGLHTSYAGRPEFFFAYFGRIILYFHIFHRQEAVKLLRSGIQSRLMLTPQSKGVLYVRSEWCQVAYFGAYRVLSVSIFVSYGRCLFCVSLSCFLPPFDLRTPRANYWIFFFAGGGVIKALRRCLLLVHTAVHTSRLACLLMRRGN